MLNRIVKNINQQIKTTIMENEFLLLEEAVSEIRSLRKQNELMNARLEVFDSMMAILHTTPAYKSQGMSPDLAYRIEKFIESRK
jgi:hypothetical protein